MKSIYYRKGWWEKLSGTSRKQIRDLSFRSEGDFCASIMEDPPYIIRLFNQSKLIGWVAYFPNLNEINTYIRKSERRKGHGRRLMKRMAAFLEERNKRNKKGLPIVWNWDATSGPFFHTLSQELGNQKTFLIRNADPFP